MNTTLPPATPAPAPVEDIPGVTRRHRPKDFYHERTNFQFIKHSRRWLVLSGTLIAIALIALFVRELNLSIEFEGGTAWQVTMANGKNASTQDVRNLLDPLGFTDAKVSTLSGSSGDSVRVQAEIVKDPILSIQQSLADASDLAVADILFVRNNDGSGNFTFQTTDKKPLTQVQVEKAMTAAGYADAKVTVDGQDVTVAFDKLPTSPLTDVAQKLADYAGVNVSEVSVSTVGPTWGETVSRKALQALIIFFIILALYLTFRFEWKMSATAIVAVIHDILVSVGVYALFQWSVSPATVTAFLTILGFSLYDTVVVYDKIKENERNLLATGKSTYPEMVNKSLNAVLMRSLSTTIVALLPVLSLLIVGSLIMGATALEDFALALAVGLAVGSYSSIFVASPLLAAWKDRDPKYKVLHDRRRRTTMAAASVATGVAVVEPDGEPREKAVVEAGIPGPPAVGRTEPSRPRTPRPRQQRRRKRR
jgi:preprotein translocase subunit SecF